MSGHHALLARLALADGCRDSTARDIADPEMATFMKVRVSVAVEAMKQVATTDHTLVAWALCFGGAEWRPWQGHRGELCINGVCHATKLDMFGIPELTATLRTALAEALTAKALGEPA